MKTLKEAQDFIRKNNIQTIAEWVTIAHIKGNGEYPLNYLKHYYKDFDPNDLPPIEDFLNLLDKYDEAIDRLMLLMPLLKMAEDDYNQYKMMEIEIKQQIINTIFNSDIEAELRRMNLGLDENDNYIE